MIPEVPSIQRQIKPEERFINLIKNEFVKHAKEINLLEEKIKELEKRVEELED